MITQIANGLRKIKLGALHPTRDFSFVSDTVQGFIAMAESDAAVGEVINLGSAFEISIGETAALIAELMGEHIDFITDVARIRPAGSEVERLFADNSKAKTLLGWKPAYGGLEGFKRGLLETIQWFTHLDNLKQYKAYLYNV